MCESLAVLEKDPAEGLQMAMAGLTLKATGVVAGPLQTGERKGHCRNDQMQVSQLSCVSASTAHLRALTMRNSTVQRWSSPSAAVRDLPPLSVILMVLKPLLSINTYFHIEKLRNDFC